MLDGVAVAGRHVLDVGCGLGAIDVILVQKYQARSVLGIDVEPQLIEHAEKRIAGAGLQNRVRFQLVEPGPLPPESESCDMVFSKDAIVHIPDKAAFFAEVMRVLTPGGVFVGSDWLRGTEQTFTARAREWLEVVHLNFDMRNLTQTRETLVSAGLEKVELTDRNDWYRSEIRDELASLSGERYDQLVALLGEQDAAYRRKVSELKQQAIEDGFLRPTHFVGYKPA